MKRLQILKIQNRLVDTENLDDNFLYNAPLGEIVEDGKYLVMTKQDAKLLNLNYFEHSYGGIGTVAWVPVALEDEKSGFDIEVEWNNGVSTRIHMLDDNDIMSFHREYSGQFQSWLKV